MSDDQFRALTLLHIVCSRASLARRPVSRPSSSEAVQRAVHFVAFGLSSSFTGQNNPVDLITQYADPITDERRLGTFPSRTGTLLMTSSKPPGCPGGFLFSEPSLAEAGTPATAHIIL